MIRAMDTCEYCDTEITIGPEVAVGPDGPERRGCCEGCGHVVSVCAGPAAGRGRGAADRALPLAS